MITLIQSVNIVLNKEEIIVTLQEINQLFSENCKSEAEFKARKEEFPMIAKLQDQLNRSASSSEIANHSTSFKLKVR